MRWFVVVAPTALIAALATPVAAEPLSVEQAVERAVRQSDEAQIARADLADAHGRVREALSAALPQVTGSVTYGRKFDSIFEGVSPDSGIGAIFANSPFGSVRDWTIELQASQLLYDGGKVGAALRGAKLFLKASQAQEDETTADLAFRAKAAYYEAAAAARLVDIAEGGLRQARDHMGQVALYHREGTRAEYDLLRAQVDAANQEPAVVAARTRRDLALLRLKQLINLPLDRPIELTTPLESEDGTIPVLAATAPVPPSRGALTAAEATVGLQQQVLRAARADRWPVFTAQTTLQHQAFPQEEWPARDQFLKNWDAQIKMSVPIFTGFRTGAAIQRAQAQLQRAEADRDRLREQVAIEVAEAQAELEQASAVLAARRETVRQASRAYELSEVRYTNGLSTQLEVSDARLGMQTAQVHQVEASRDYLLALAGLERALGHPVPLERKPLESLSVSWNVQEKRP